MTNGPFDLFVDELCECVFEIVDGDAQPFYWVVAFNGDVWSGYSLAGYVAFGDTVAFLGEA